mgnify:CR=1 FL=1
MIPHLFKKATIPSLNNPELIFAIDQVRKAKNKEKALEIAHNSREKDNARISALQQYFFEELAKNFPEVRINGGFDMLGTTLSYSKLKGALNKKGILINRKMLSELAEKAPETFSRLVKQVS